MTKHFFLFSMLLLCLKFTNAQDSVEFNMHYLPLHKYEETLTQTIDAETGFSGNDSVMAVLKQQGIANHLDVNKDIVMNAEIITGNYSTNNKMPVELAIELTDANGKPIIAANTKMLGTIEQNKMPVINSVTSGNYDAATQKQLVNQANNMLSQISFPHSKITPGGNCVHNTTVSIPMGNEVMSMIISISYKLVSLTDSVAGFDLSLYGKLDMNEDDDSLFTNGTANGTGSMMFDRKNDFPLTYQMQYEMKLNTAMNDTEINVVINSSSKAVYIIKDIKN